MQKTCVASMKKNNLNYIFVALLLAVSLPACVWEELPVIDTGEGIVEESRQKLQEEIIMGPGFDPAMRDSLIKELTPLLLEEPGMRALENWYSLKSLWLDRFGAEENMQLYANLVYEKFFTAENFRDAAKVKLAQGRVHYLSNKYEEAIEHTQKSFELALTAGDSATMAWSLNYMSGPFYFAGKEQVAIEALNRAKLIGERIDCQTVLVSVNSAIASIMAREGKIDSAMHLFNVALANSKKHGMTEFEDVILANMGFSLLRYDRALEALNIVKPRMHTVNNKVTISTSLLSIIYGEASLQLGRFDEAKEYLDKGCEKSGKLGFAYGELKCSRLMASYYEQNGNPSKALEYYKEYHNRSKAHLNESTRKKAEVYDVDMRVRDRNREIEKLQLIESEREKQYNLVIGLYATLVVLLVSGAIVFFYISRSRSQVKMAVQKRIAAEAKLNVLQAQMKPHFIYNAMSGIQNYILKSDTIKAYNYLSRFASLLRIITKSSAHISIELEVEIELLKNYLELEQMRFRKAFTYNFDIDESLLQENLNIPNMMIQPMVENAIIHGLSGMESNGLIDISIHRDGEDGILCIVTDNGRGRDAALEISSKQDDLHLSIATVNSEERIKSLQDLGFKNAQVEFEDLFTDGAPSGTSVYISLPFIRKINAKPNGTKHTISHS